MNAIRKLLLTLCAALCLSCAAQAEEITLAQLKEQVPNYLQMNVTTEAGETVEILAPVVLPEGDALPVLRCRQATFDASDMTDVYPRDPDEPEYMRIAGTYWNVEDSPLLVVLRNWDHGNGQTVHKRLPQGETPPHVEVTIDRAREILLEEAARFDCDIVPELRLERAVPYSGVYSTKAGTFFEADKAIAGKERGMWVLEFSQVIRGARVISNFYYPTGEPVAEDGMVEVWGSVTNADIDISAEDSYAMSLSLLVEQDELSPDSPLLPFDELQKIIEERVACGQLHSVYTLTLGYYPFYEAGKRRNDWIVDENGNQVQDPHSTATYILKPVWRIQGVDEKDRSHFSMSGELPDREEALYHDPGDPDFELLLDARTGQVLTSNCYQGE